MTRFVITAFTTEGPLWETTRNTKKGLDFVISEIMKDTEIVRYTVEEFPVPTMEELMAG